MNFNVALNIRSQVSDDCDHREISALKSNDIPCDIPCAASLAGHPTSKA